MKIANEIMIDNNLIGWYPIKEISIHEVTMSIRRRPDMYEKHILPKRKKYEISHRCIDCGIHTEYYRCDKCKASRAIYAREWREKNHNYVLLLGKKWRDKNRDKIKLQNKKANAKQYGMSIEEYEKKVTIPCGICGRTDKRRCIDHCHTTNNIRGVLCISCNSMLGWYEKYKQEIFKWEHEGRR